MQKGCICVSAIISYHSKDRDMLSQTNCDEVRSGRSIDGKKNENRILYLFLAWKGGRWVGGGGGEEMRVGVVVLIICISAGVQDCIS